MRIRISSAIVSVFFALSFQASAQDKVSFPAGTTMEKIQQRGKLIVGVKYDQPGMGLMNPSTGRLEGFDIEISKKIAAGLGLTEDQIEFKEAVSKNRIPFIDGGVVDIVIASFGITPESKKAVDLAGPYFKTGMQALVRIEDKDKYKTFEDLKGVKACATTGSDSLRVSKRVGAEPVAFDTYNECVQQLITGGVDAIPLTTILLAGYVQANPGKVAIAVEPFNPYRFGIGLKKGDKPFCDFINKTLQAAIDDGSWQKALDATVGRMGVTNFPPPDDVGSDC